MVEFRLGHFLDQFLEGGLGRPAQRAPGLAGVADQMHGFGGAQKVTIESDMRLPVERDGGKGGFDHVLHTVQDAGGKEVIVGRFVVECQPHAPDIITGMSPVALGAGVAEYQFLLQAQFDGGGGMADLAGDEVFAPAARFVIVKNAVDSEQAMTVAIDAHHLSRERLGAAVGIDRCDGGILGLRALGGTAEDFAGGGMEEARWLGEIAQDLQQPQGAHGGEFAGGLGDLEAQADMTLPGEMIQLLRADLIEHTSQGRGVVEVGVVQKEPLIVDAWIGVEMREPAAFERAGAAD